MRAQDIIRKKRDGGELAAGEIGALIAGMTAGEIPDYQVTAFLMAAFLRGLSRDETIALTGAMVESGARLSFADLDRPAVDKHSTGGVGDKPSLVVAPVAAACGAAVPMIAGRGLGFTGGTLDKLEAIPGYNVALPVKAFEDQVRQVGVAIAGQTEEMAPADRTLYALRDVTATVASVPLITASILSKKIAEGAGALLLDVKVGRGALMRDADSARELARSLIDVGRGFGLTVRALLTDMDQPLGRMIGNACEVAESVAILRGKGESRVTELCRLLTGHMLDLAGLAASPEAGGEAYDRAIADGSGLRTFTRMVRAQGGDPERIPTGDDPFKTTHVFPLAAQAAGSVAAVDARALGEAAMQLGAGRAKASDAINPRVGIEVGVRIGDRVRPGMPLAIVHYDDAARFEAVVDGLAGAFAIEDGPVDPPPLVLDVLE